MGDLRKFERLDLRDGTRRGRTWIAARLEFSVEGEGLLSTVRQGELEVSRSRRLAVETLPLLVDTSAAVSSSSRIGGRAVLLSSSAEEVLSGEPALALDTLRFDLLADDGSGYTHSLFPLRHPEHGQPK